MKLLTRGLGSGGPLVTRGLLSRTVAPAAHRPDPDRSGGQQRGPDRSEGLQRGPEPAWSTGTRR